jgi:hypothetical protein
MSAAGRHTGHAGDVGQVFFQPGSEVDLAEVLLVAGQPAFPFHGLCGLELALVVTPLGGTGFGAVVVEHADQIEAAGLGVDVGEDGGGLGDAVLFRVVDEAVGVGDGDLGALAVGTGNRLSRSWIL